MAQGRRVTGLHAPVLTTAGSERASWWSLRRRAAQEPVVAGSGRDDLGVAYPLLPLPPHTLLGVMLVRPAAAPKVTEAERAPWKYVPPGQAATTGPRGRRPLSGHLLEAVAYVLFSWMLLSGVAGLVASSSWG